MLIKYDTYDDLLYVLMLLIDDISQITTVNLLLKDPHAHSGIKYIRVLLDILSNDTCNSGSPTTHVKDHRIGHYRDYQLPEPIIDTLSCLPMKRKQEKELNDTTSFVSVNFPSFALSPLAVSLRMTENPYIVMTIH